MGWIEQQATEAWAPEEEGATAQAAFDFLKVQIEPIPVPAPPYLETEESESQTQWSQTTEPTPTATAGHSSGQGWGHERYMGEPPTSSNEGLPRKRRRHRAPRERREDV